MLIHNAGADSVQADQDLIPSFLLPHSRRLPILFSTSALCTMPSAIGHYMLLIALSIKFHPTITTTVKAGMFWLMARVISGTVPRGGGATEARPPAPPNSSLVLCNQAQPQAKLRSDDARRPQMLPPPPNHFPAPWGELGSVHGVQTSPPSQTKSANFPIPPQHHTTSTYLLGNLFKILNTNIK